MPRAYIAIGVAPENAASYTDDVENALRTAFSDKNVRAIGSCGLSEKADDAEQIAFARQIALAKELDAVLVVEAHGAYDQALTLLEQSGFPRRHVIVRSFDGSPEQADAWTAHGCFISLGAEAENDPVSYSKLARRIPPDRLLVESGAPESTLIALGGSEPRCDQVVLVADAIQGACPGPQLAANFLTAIER